MNTFIYREFGPDGASTMAEAYVPDMATEIDLPHEILAERFGLPLATAAAVSAWHTGEVEGEANARLARDLGKIMSLLLDDEGDMVAKVWALGFSFGLILPMNGVRNLAAAAARIGRHRALLSHYKRTWDALLGSTVRIFGKAEATCEKYRESRVAYVRTGIKKADRENL